MESLQLDVSSRNSVLGLYHGWYRAPNNSFLGLKHIEFERESDWIRARHVLIGPRAAKEVAGYGKKILKTLRFIPKAAFDEKYATSTSPTPQPTPDPIDDHDAPSETPPQGAPDSDQIAMKDLRKRVRELEMAVRAVGKGVDHINQQVAELKALSGFATDRSPSPSVRLTRVGEPVSGPRSGPVDYQSVWPAGHVASGWCDVSRRTIGIGVLDPNDPIRLKYGLGGNDPTD